jgi:hypothetical protein
MIMLLVCAQDNVMKWSKICYICNYHGCSIYCDPVLLVLKAAGEKYDIVFPRMACTMIISVYNDDHEDVPTLSGKQVMFLPFKY